MTGIQAVNLVVVRYLVGKRAMVILRHRVRAADEELAHGTARAVLGSPFRVIHFLPANKQAMLGRKCGHAGKKYSATPEKPKKLVKEPVPEAKGYEEIRARIGKGKK